MSKSNRILLAFLFLVFSANSAEKADRFSKTQSVLFEAGGHGGIYSLNYEGVFFNRKKMKIAIQTGVSYFPRFTGIRDSWFPTSLLGIYSFNDKHHAELGIGHTFTYEATRSFNNSIMRWGAERFATFRTGYRYQQPDSRMILRVGLTVMSEEPKYRYIQLDDLFLLPAASVGWAF